jgi:ABC-type multidrug transport system permease subunit
MRWLLIKDLQILRRSPFLVSLLVVYPIAIALLIGFALSKGPDKPKVAFLNLVAVTNNKFNIGGASIDASKYSSTLFKSVDRVDVKSRAEAIKKVRDGDVLAALIIPKDITAKLAGGVEQPVVETIYNTEDPVKAQFVESTIKARLADANAALSKNFIKVAAQYINLLLKGGQFAVFGQNLNILGLQNSERIIKAAIATLGHGSSPAAAQSLGQVARFAQIAIDNLDLTDDVLRSVGQPLAVKRTVLKGSKTPLDDFAVAVSVTMSLMFVTVLLAAGMLALEREENAFARLVRGLVSKLGLLAEKIGLAALCAFVVGLVMTVGIAAFIGLDWSRFPLWVAGLAGGAVAFAAMGVAIGAVAREVRAASLLAFLLSLPIAFLALVPSGAVSGGLFNLIRVVSALFPFKPALQALDAAFNHTNPGLGPPLIHLALLTLAFTAIARVSLRRFG